MSSASVDVLIVGGGSVGATTAVLLARCGIQVALIDARPPSFDIERDYGLRMSAVSPGSAAILGQAGAWDRVQHTRACAYRRMRVEDRQSDSAVEFDASQFGMERLGTIVENDLLRSAVWQQLESNPLIDLHCPARLEHIQQDDNEVQLTLDDGSRLRASLLIGCDGAGSVVRRWMAGGSDIWTYNQSGVVAVVAKQNLNPGVAWQRFLTGGPLAFLPLSDGRSSIVWTLPSQQAKELLEMEQADFVAALDQASEGWLGKVESAGQRGSFPLTMRLNRQWVRGRVVLLGDAAHVVHPLAGQGLNIGLADSAALLETVVANRRAGRDLAQRQSLLEFERWRKSESAVLAGGIHALGGLFRPDALVPLRKFALRTIAKSWFARETFVRRAAGQSGNAPRLARGDSIQALLR